jgi:uncharacterized membrane protein (DUF106 family)
MISYIEEIIGVLISTVVGALVWFVRTVLTSQKKIELLEKDIATRDKRREEDRELWLGIKEDLRLDMQETRKDIKDIRSELLTISQNQK